MKRSMCLLMALSLMTMCLFGCTSSGSGEASSVAASSVASVESHEPVAYDVNLATLAGPTGMGMAFMLDSEDTINRYHYTVASAPDQVTAKLINGDYDIAALPTNVAATLYNASEGKVKLLGLNTLGVLYVLEKGDTIRSISDLKGKKVYVSGQGSTPDFLLKYLLTANGIDPENDLTMDFTYSTHADLVAFAASGQADVVLLPEPTVTALLSQNSEMRVALNLNDVWKDAVAGTDHEDSVVSMGCVAVRTEFAEKNPEAVANFLTDYRNSVEKVNSDLDAAAEKIEALGIVAKAAVAKKALPRCNIVLITGQDMADQIQPFYQVLFDANPKSIGGKMPEHDFYYIG